MGLQTLRIGIDVDGVLACFFKAYEDLIVEVAGVDLFPARYPEALPPTWNWPEFYGYSDETMKEVWQRIRSSLHFWKSLEPLPGAQKFLEALYRDDTETYFITDRPGVSAQYQTAKWLDDNRFGYPSVILSGRHLTKGQACAALHLDIYLDDKGENVLDCEEKAPNTRTLCLTYPYNEGFKVKERVGSLEEALEAIRG